MQIILFYFRLDRPKFNKTHNLQDLKMSYSKNLKSECIRDIFQQLTCQFNSPASLSTYHLTNPVETLAMEAECLFKQHLVLHCPLIRKRCEVCQISQGFLHTVLVPEEHSKGLKAEQFHLWRLQIHN